MVNLEKPTLTLAYGQRSCFKRGANLFALDGIVLRGRFCRYGFSFDTAIAGFLEYTHASQWNEPLRNDAGNDRYQFATLRRASP
jgi:hypothetical protein